MRDEALTKIRGFLQGRLSLKDDRSPWADGESLFVSGRLDSLDAMQTVVFLEDQFGLDFSHIGFSIDLIDTAQDIAELVQVSPC